MKACSSLLVVFLLSGCVAPKAPCLTGFEVGVNGGQSHGRWRGRNTQSKNGHLIEGDRTNVRDNYVGGHTTAFFDTTGGCNTYYEYEEQNDVSP